MLKKFLKRYAPPKLWSQLRDAKKYIRKKGGFSIKAGWNILRVLISENSQIIDLLDYPNAKILMRAGSISELNRLCGCQKEPETIEWLESHLKPGDVLYDVGANVGAYSLVACSILRKRGTIYAIEPNPPVFASLCKNIYLNNFQENIIPLPIILSNATILTPTLGDNLYTNTWKADDLLSSCFHIQPPNHMKIDVDGNELDVIRGMDRLLSSPSLRSILIEIDENIRHSSTIKEILEQKGFSTASKRRHGEKLINYIFKRK